MNAVISITQTNCITERFKNYSIQISFIDNKDLQVTMAQKKITLLKYNHIMEYDWGSQDKNCIINQLRQEVHPKYAELWMGTHPKGPSKLQNQTHLSQFLHKKSMKQLLFLYKVLCIQKALSIQLHPNKKEAEELFLRLPHIYGDDNQKPQMFLTLTQFQCLFGLLPAEDLVNLFTMEPFSLLKSKESKKIKDIIQELLQLPQNLRKGYVDLAINNIQQLFPQRKKLLVTLQQQFPYDQGILVSCILRYKVLPPGECFAIAAGVPHAYLKGSCLQIMKNSDNVVRLGLTPKLKDIKTMLQIMNDTVGLDGLKVQKTADGYIWNNLVLNPIIILTKEQQTITIKNISIGIIFEGSFYCSSEEFKAEKGEIIFVQAGEYKVQGPFKVYFGGYQYE